MRMIPNRTSCLSVARTRGRSIGAFWPIGLLRFRCCRDEQLRVASRTGKTATQHVRPEAATLAQHRNPHVPLGLVAWSGPFDLHLPIRQLDAAYL